MATTIIFIQSCRIPLWLDGLDPLTLLVVAFVQQGNLACVYVKKGVGSSKTVSSTTPQSYKFTVSLTGQTIKSSVAHITPFKK